MPSLPHGLISRSSSVTLSVNRQSSFDGTSEDLAIAQRLLNQPPRIPRRQASLSGFVNGLQSLQIAHSQVDYDGPQEHRRSRDDAQRTSTTWSSDGEPRPAELDDIDDRTQFVKEYNLLAQKHGVREIVLDDFEANEEATLASDKSTSSSWLARLRKRTPSDHSAKSHKHQHHQHRNPKHRRSISDLSLRTKTGRRDALKDKDLQELVRLCGVSLLYLPAEYAVGSLGLPTCFRATAQYLVQHAPSARGVFRIPGSHSVVAAIYQHYCVTDIDGEMIAGTVHCPAIPDHIKCDVHDVASTFKKFVAGLPGGILGSLSLFDAFISIQSQLQIDPEWTRTKQTKARARLIALAILTLKSKYRRDLICAVFGLLCMVGRAAETTPREDERGHPLPTSDLMGYSALGIVFGPLLIGELLDDYTMHIANPHGGLVLLPISPPKSKKEKQKKRVSAEAGITFSTHVDKIKVANSVTEMVIIHWREVVRHLRNINALRGVVEQRPRPPILRPSASETFSMRKPPDWSDSQTLVRNIERNESPTPLSRIPEARQLNKSESQNDMLQVRKQRSRPWPISTQKLSGSRSMSVLAPTVEETSNDRSEEVFPNGQVTTQYSEGGRKPNVAPVSTPKETHRDHKQHRSRSSSRHRHDKSGGSTHSKSSRHGKRRSKSPLDHHRKHRHRSSSRSRERSAEKDHDNSMPRRQGKLTKSPKQYGKNHIEYLKAIGMEPENLGAQPQEKVACRPRKSLEPPSKVHFQPEKVTHSQDDDHDPIMDYRHYYHHHSPAPDGVATLGRDPEFESHLARQILNARLTDSPSPSKQADGSTPNSRPRKPNVRIAVSSEIFPRQSPSGQYRRIAASEPNDPPKLRDPNARRVSRTSYGELKPKRAWDNSLLQAKKDPLSRVSQEKDEASLAALARVMKSEEMRGVYQTSALRQPPVSSIVQEKSFNSIDARPMRSERMTAQMPADLPRYKTTMGKSDHEGQLSILKPEHTLISDRVAISAAVPPLTESQRKRKDGYLTSSHTRRAVSEGSPFEDLPTFIQGSLSKEARKDSKSPLSHDYLPAPRAQPGIPHTFIPQNHDSPSVSPLPTSVVNGDTIDPGARVCGITLGVSPSSVGHSFRNFDNVYNLSIHNYSGQPPRSDSPGAIYNLSVHNYSGSPAGTKEAPHICVRPAQTLSTAGRPYSDDLVNSTQAGPPGRDNVKVHSAFVNVPRSGSAPDSGSALDPCLVPLPIPHSRNDEFGLTEDKVDRDTGIAQSQMETSQEKLPMTMSRSDSNNAASLARSMDAHQSLTGLIGMPRGRNLQDASSELPCPDKDHRATASESVPAIQATNESATLSAINNTSPDDIASQKASRHASSPFLGDEHREASQRPSTPVQHANVVGRSTETKSRSDKTSVMSLEEITGKEHNSALLSAVPSEPDNSLSLEPSRPEAGESVVDIEDVQPTTTFPAKAISRGSPNRSQISFSEQRATARSSRTSDPSISGPGTAKDVSTSLQGFNQEPDVSKSSNKQHAPALAPAPLFEKSTRAGEVRAEVSKPESTDQSPSKSDAPSQSNGFFKRFSISKGTKSVKNLAAKFNKPEPFFPSMLSSARSSGKTPIKTSLPTRAFPNPHLAESSSPSRYPAQSESSDMSSPLRTGTKSQLPKTPSSPALSPKSRIPESSFSMRYKTYSSDSDPQSVSRPLPGPNGLAPHTSSPLKSSTKSDLTDPGGGRASRRGSIVAPYTINTPSPTRSQKSARSDILATPTRITPSRSQLSVRPDDLVSGVTKIPSRSLQYSRSATPVAPSVMNTPARTQKSVRSDMPHSLGTLAKAHASAVTPHSGQSKTQGPSHFQFETPQAPKPQSSPSKQITPRRLLKSSLNDCTPLRDVEKSVESMQSTTCYTINANNPYAVPLRSIKITPSPSRTSQKKATDCDECTFDGATIPSTCGTISAAPDPLPVAHCVQFPKRGGLQSSWQDDACVSPSPPVQSRSEALGRSNSMLHAQVRNLQVQLSKKDEDIRQLRNQIKMRNSFDSGTLSEKLRETQRELEIWKTRAECAEKQVELLSKIPSRNVSRHATQERQRTEYSPCKKQSDIGFDDSCRTVERVHRAMHGMDGVTSSEWASEESNNTTILRDISGNVASGSECSAWQECE